MKIKLSRRFISIFLALTLVFSVSVFAAQRDYFHTGLDVSRSQLKSLIDGWNGALGFAGSESVVALDGTTYYVNTNITVQGDGQTWDNAFKTLTKALSVAIMRNDVIIVAPGDYDEGATLNITTQGLTIKGSDPSGGWQNRALILDGAAVGYHLMTINANEVTIQGLGFSAAADTYDAIRVGTTMSPYKVTIKNNRFDGYGTGEHAIYQDGIYDAPDLAILNNEFRSWMTASIRVNTTRALIGGNIITILGSTSGIIHVPTGGSRPDTTIIDNKIFGVYNGDTGIQIVGTPTEYYFHMSGNSVVGCETPVTLAKYTNWYVGNYWGKENWRYDPNSGRAAAEARGADGNIFYMDLNMLVTGLDGRCWASAFGTLAAAITAADTDVGIHRNWARRNTIYVIGDEIHEDITVLAEKTDIVGVGTDLAAYPRMFHSWDIAVAVKGARFFNIGFENDAADAAVTLPAGTNGAEFHNCHFARKDAGTHGLSVTSSSNVKIIGCEFLQDGLGGGVYTTSAIEILGNIFHWEIRDNFITGAVGITAELPGGYGSRIVNNVIRTTGQTIDDDSNTLIVTGNTLISDGTSDTTASNGSFDMNLLLAADNRLTCADEYNAPVPLEGTLD